MNLIRVICVALLAGVATPFLLTTPATVILRFRSGENNALDTKRHALNALPALQSRQTIQHSNDRMKLPLLVFVNKASGDLKGKALLSLLRTVLDARQICDLQSQNPVDFIKQWQNRSENLKVLCCGGDGTVSWILSLLLQYDMSQVAVGIVPLGTGNDLANVCASKNPKHKCLTADEIISRPTESLLAFSNPDYSYVDIWNVTCTPPSHMLAPSHTLKRAYDTAKQWKRMHWGKRRYYKNKIMINYYGIGLDGAVTLEFNNIRHKLPFLFASRFINKVWYGAVGLRTFLLRAKQDLSQAELRIDGKKVPIPSDAQGVIVLNVNSYAGGSVLWKPSPLDATPPRADDGIVEIIALKDIKHLGKIAVGLDRGEKIGQGRIVEITTRQTLPMQIDGEPWRQRPCTLRLSQSRKAKIMIPDR